MTTTGLTYVRTNSRTASHNVAIASGTGVSGTGTEDVSAANPIHFKMSVTMVFWVIGAGAAADMIAGVGSLTAGSAAAAVTLGESTVRVVSGATVAVTSPPAAAWPSAGRPAATGVAACTPVVCDVGVVSAAEAGVAYCLTGLRENRRSALPAPVSMVVVSDVVVGGADEPRSPVGASVVEDSLPLRAVVLLGGSDCPVRGCCAPRELTAAPFLGVRAAEIALAVSVLAVALARSTPESEGVADPGGAPRREFGAPGVCDETEP